MNQETTAALRKISDEALDDAIHPDVVCMASNLPCGDLSEALKERDRLRAALDDAASSLEWIANRVVIKGESQAEARMEMRGYASSRARAAREALNPKPTA